MTEEQIRQNAEKYASQLVERDYHEDMWLDLYDAYIAGAHSRDEEIKELNARILNLMCERDSIKIESEYLIDKLRNPWYNAADNLPEHFNKRPWRSISVLAKFTDGSHHECFYDFTTRKWRKKSGSTAVADGKITHWMKIPELKGGEK